MKDSYKKHIEKTMRILPDSIYIKIMFRYHLGYFPNLKKPRSFAEKIQWLKLYDFDPKMTDMVDKIRVKEYVGKIIGEEYIVPLLGVWDNVEEIDIDTLPDQFVLKCNHDGQSVVICKNKQLFNCTEAKRFLQLHLKNNAYWYGRERPYKNVVPKVFAEKYIGPQKGDIVDYKFFCFNGIPMYCQVISDRKTNETINFYDMEWNLQEFTGLATFKKSTIAIPRPYNLTKMINFATKLSQGKRFVRIDFYEVEKQLYFGEITFYPASGFGKFMPIEWDDKISRLINVSSKNKYSPKYRQNRKNMI